MLTFCHRKEFTLLKTVSLLIKKTILADDDASKDQTQGLVNLSRLPKAFMLKLDHCQAGLSEALHMVKHRYYR